MTVFVIVTYRRADLLEACLKSLASVNAGGPPWAAVLVHNGGPLHMRDWIRSRWGTDPAFRLVLLPDNLGFSTAANVGIREALGMGATTVVLVNDDIQFTRPVLGPLSDAFSHPLIGTVGAKLLYPDGTIQHGGMRRSGQEISHRFHGQPGQTPGSDVPADVCVTGALVAWRRSMMDQIGLLDEGFRMGSEDVDYCLSSLKAGYRVVYWPEFTAIHWEGATRGRDDREKGPELAKADRLGRQRLVEKWGAFLQESIRVDSGPDIVWLSLDSHSVAGALAAEDCTKLAARGWLARIVSGPLITDSEWLLRRSLGLKVAASWAEAALVFSALAPGEQGFVLVHPGAPRPGAAEEAAWLSRLRPLCSSREDAWDFGRAYSCDPVILPTGEARWDVLEEVFGRFDGRRGHRPEELRRHQPLRSARMEPARGGYRVHRSFRPGTGPASELAAPKVQPPRVMVSVRVPELPKGHPSPKKVCLLGKLGNPPEGRAFSVSPRHRL